MLLLNRHRYLWCFTKNEDGLCPKGLTVGGTGESRGRKGKQGGHLYLFQLSVLRFSYGEGKDSLKLSVGGGEFEQIKALF